MRATRPATLERCVPAGGHSVDGGTLAASVDARPRRDFSRPGEVLKAVHEDATRLLLLGPTKIDRCLGAKGTQKGIGQLLVGAIDAQK